VIKETIKAIKISAPEIKHIKETAAEKLAGSEADGMASIEGITDGILAFGAFVTARFLQLVATATAAGSTATLAILTTAGTDIMAHVTTI